MALDQKIFKHTESHTLAKSIIMYSSVALLPVAFLLFGHGTTAPTTSVVAGLLARDYTGFDECTDDQKNKINRALQDAAVMARLHATNRGQQTYRSSPA